MPEVFSTFNPKTRRTCYYIKLANGKTRFISKAQALGSGAGIRKKRTTKKKGGFLGALTSSLFADRKRKGKKELLNSIKPIDFSSIRKPAGRGFRFIKP